MLEIWGFTTTEQPLLYHGKAAGPVNRCHVRKKRKRLPEKIYKPKKKLIRVGDKRVTSRRLTAQDRERRGGKCARSGRRKLKIFKAILRKMTSLLRIMINYIFYLVYHTRDLSFPDHWKTWFLLIVENIGNGREGNDDLFIIQRQTFVGEDDVHSFCSVLFFWCLALGIAVITSDKTAARSSRRSQVNGEMVGLLRGLSQLLVRVFSNISPNTYTANPGEMTISSQVCGERVLKENQSGRNGGFRTDTQRNHA